MFHELVDFIDDIVNQDIDDSRKEMLEPLIKVIRSKYIDGLDIRLHFICTHNSRRSHLGQVWMQTLAEYFGVDGMWCYSGGTESTAVYPVIIETLEQCGLKIRKIAGDENPVYAVKYSHNDHPVWLFSKRYDHFVNPESNFVAIMTCDEADKNCPLIPGAESRISITYEDPKVSDGTPGQSDAYIERSRQIATELCYVLQQVVDR